MYAGTDFPPATPADDQPYTIDFINDLQTGETITSATVTLLLEQGVDPDPSSHLPSSYFITNGTMVSQRVRGLIAGNIYTLSITANGSLGFSDNLFSRIAVQAVF